MTLTRDQLREAVDIMLAARVGICGGNWAIFDADNLVAFLSNPDQWEADAEGVTVDQLRRYRECNDGADPQCGGKTKRGRRCRLAPAAARGGGCYQNPKRFAEVDGDYCHLHGGGDL